MDIPLKMKATVAGAAATAGAIGIGGAFAGPHGDVMLLSPTWTVAAVRLADQAGKSLDRHVAAKLVAGLLGSIGAFAGGMKVATSTFALTGVATVPALVANAGLNAVVTWLALRAMAQVFIEHDLHQTVANLLQAILGVLGVLGGWLRPSS